MSIDLVLYGTLGCHLCDDAQAIIRDVLEANPAIADIVNLNYADISDSDRMMALYAERIPVLGHEQSDKELNWPFDHQAFVEFLNSILRAAC
ncbi:thiol-disulfide isomerase [Hahella sp. CCB-MM4]|uniref:glutaredoxin family protein n=1 Tax=Hahella sp. (strain CCB-MM4) TaxID=1926491 RepID=UPI000B9B74E4|nr:glutaredoxin family protein [Hahella sp. CCB-MM4]OZG71232.1 thiol-disulfide isomerase [Hahella sp. CCB-MM4]